MKILWHWFLYLLQKPRAVNVSDIKTDVDEQRRVREIWMRLERVGANLQELARDESHKS